VVRLLFPRKAFAAATGGNFHPLMGQAFHSHVRARMLIPRFVGTIKAQFELSNLPEHKKLGPTLVVRVLDVGDPIAAHPRYEGVPPVPVPGTLLQRKRHGRICALAIPLKLQPMAEDLIALAKTTWA
jgi:hypothetical protein